MVFLCGSLEPGFDGVGDYTRRLAGELIRKGNEATIIALRDKHITETLYGFQDADGTNVTTLRIPFKTKYRKTQQLVTACISSIDPEWLSLQFVPYSFNKKGIPIVFARLMKNLVMGRKLHLMIHECWIGENTKTIKGKVTSALQRMVIRNMITSLKPRTIHTHLPAYRSDIRKLGFDNVKKLPLFSNIPEYRMNNKPQSNVFRIGVFSQATISSSMIDFLTVMGERCVSNGDGLEVVFIGGRKESLVSCGQVIEQLDNYKNKVKYTGFLSPVEVSQALQSCSLGITSVPRHGLGKSGSVAAFLSHGIPVAAPNIHKGYQATDIGFFDLEISSAIVLEPEIGLLKKSRDAALSIKKRISLSSIASAFLSDLCLQTGE